MSAALMQRPRCIPANTNKIQLERALGISTLPQDAILADGDKPYKNQSSALIDRKARGLNKTHISQRIEGGFALVPKASNAAVGAAALPAVQHTGAQAVQEDGDGNGVAKQRKPENIRLVIKRDMVGESVELQAINKSGSWERQVRYDTMQTAKDSLNSQGYDADAVPLYESSWDSKTKKFSAAKPAAKETSSAQAGNVKLEPINVKQEAQPAAESKPSDPKQSAIAAISPAT